ncbi:MAG: hypothetical protein Q4Q19_03505 [Methanobrevibacter sp.]|nr:hypothetical protein [Methanobrevibacter sp.]
MAYDDTSFYGDMIVDEYDDKNNLMNPASPVGYLFYHLLGDGFDAMSDMCSKFLNDLSVLSCDSSSLDNFWGVSYNLPRPTLPVSGRLLTDDEYRVYLYLLNCRLITVEDILINFNKCFGRENYEIFLSEETHYLEVVDHNNYVSEENLSSNIAKKNDDASNHYITNHERDDDTETIESLLSTVEETETIINIPPKSDNPWSTEFLEFLMPYISIKGNVRIKEYKV